MAATFQQAVAETLGVAADWVLAGNGSDDLLTMLFRAVAGPGRAVAYPSPTYVLYRTLSAMQEAPVIEAPFDADYRFPVDALITADAALTLVANPNSPSGTLVQLDDLDRLAAGLDGLLVVDEAYVAFASSDALPLIRSHDNVLVLRTLSKSHGLAGLRLGFAVGQPAVLAGLTKVKDSYNVDAVAMTVGASALRDTVYTAEVVARIIATRTHLVAALEQRGFRVWPSQANFVLARPVDGDARRLHAGLDARGVLVRYFDEPGLDDCLRITVGTDEEHARLHRLTTPTSLDRTIGDDDSTELVDLLPDSTPGPELQVMAMAENDMATSLLDVLDNRARYAVEQRFGLTDGRKRSYREVGEDLGVTAEAARRLVKRAVTTVRERASEYSDVA